jgi:LysM repeat protein
MTTRVRDLGNALVVTVVSVGLMLGALSISLVEFVPEAAPTATSLLLPSPMPLTPTSTLPPTFTPETALDTVPTPTLLLAASPSSCPPPAGWGPIVIRPSDTLDSIATNYRTTSAQLRSANCLVSDGLVVGAVLYVPPVPTNTFVACSSGAVGWVRNYTVRRGDTLYSIASNYSTTASLLKQVNCRTSDIIYAGEILWVPNVPTRTPTPSPLPGTTNTPHPTDPLTLTALPFTATVAPSNTPVPSTPTPAPTATPVPTLTASPTAFPTPTP